LANIWGLAPELMPPVTITVARLPHVHNIELLWDIQTEWTNKK